MIGPSKRCRLLSVLSSTLTRNRPYRRARISSTSHSISTSSCSSSLPKAIIFGSCSHQNEELRYWDTIVTLKPDLVILGGDNVYGGVDLSTLRIAYDHMNRNSSFNNAAKSFPIIAAIDDNDYGNDGDACEANPNKEMAKTMFLDFFQVPTNDPRRSKNRGSYTSYQWDQSLQVILLDLRYNKSPFLDTDEPGAAGKECHIPDYFNRSKTMLGEDQWFWLETELEKPSHVRLIVSPLQLLADGHGFECWKMLPYEKERMINLLRQATGTTIVLSGDRHASALYQQDDLIEVTSSSLTHTIEPGKLDMENDTWRIGDFVYSNNFGMLQFNWESKALSVTIHDAITGDVIKEWSVALTKS